MTINHRGRRHFSMGLTTCAAVVALAASGSAAAIATTFDDEATANGASGNEAEAARDILIRGVTVFGRGEGAEPLESGAVLIRDGRIVAVGPDVDAPTGNAWVIEVDGGSITPGLIDANALIEPADMITIEERASRPATTTTVGDFMSALAEHEHHNHATDFNGDALAADQDGALLNPWEGGAGFDPCQLATRPDEWRDAPVCPVCGGPIASEPEEAHVSGVMSAWDSRVEATSEVVPHTYVLDSLNLASPDFDRLLREGVTTVFAAPDAAAVIGPRGAVVRTGGPLSERVVVESSDVTITMGTDPYRVGGGNMPPYRSFISSRTRRPSSRMGVAWVIRKAFYDLERYLGGAPVAGADAPPLDAMDSLAAIRSGELPVRIKARTAQDIETSYRLRDELGLAEFTLVEATEAYQLVELIANEESQVIFGPIYADPRGVRERSNETDESRLLTMRELIAAGVPTALSAHDLREEDGLARQAMYAMRSGVSFADALRAVTIIPARMLGLDDEIGSIESGKRADLVVWSGRAFEATSRPLIVIVGGAVMYDAREQ